MTLSWSPALSGFPPTYYRITAGTTPGGVDLGSSNVGLATSVTATLPNGLYFARVLAGNASEPVRNHLRRRSASALRTCPARPESPWSAPMAWTSRSPSPRQRVEIPPTSYVILAGTSPGAVNLGEYPIGLATAVTATLGAGRYFVRTIGVNAGDRASASPDVEFSVLGDGRISTEAAGDIIAYNQSLGSSYRIPGSITRWELPVPVHVDPSMDINLVTQALEGWKAWTGITYTFVPNVEPRLLIRTGVDGVVSGGRGLVDGTYSNNQARSGLAVIHPNGANSARLPSAYELGHALGIFDHLTYRGLMGGSGRFTTPRARARLLRSLYHVPHGATVLPNGTWQVSALLPPGPVRWEWQFGAGSTISFTWVPPTTGGHHRPTTSSKSARHQV